jgi:hypothetical protein
LVDGGVPVGGHEGKCSGREGADGEAKDCVGAGVGGVAIEGYLVEIGTPLDIATDEGVGAVGGGGGGAEGGPFAGGGLLDEGDRLAGERGAVRVCEGAGESEDLIDGGIGVGGCEGELRS